MMDDALIRTERWARFRFSVIGGLLASPPEGGALQEALRDLAARTYQHPFTSERMRLGFSTLERWYYQAKATADPLAALGRKVRADTGRTWALAPELLALLAAQYQRYPRWTVQLHYDNLAAEIAKRPDLGALPSYQTVRRRMQEQGWVRRKGPRHPTAGQQRALDRRDAREVRSFEASTVHGLWHLDFHQARVKVLDAAGRWHTPMVLAILDDHSRLCCHLQGYLAETAECLVHGLTQALLKRGLPRALLTDNGAAMLAAETREGLARLGIVHETTLPYSPYQNGKQEVFWAQLEGRLLELLRDVTPLRLAFLNQAAQAWVEQDYHRRPHRELAGATPLARLCAGPDGGRPAPDPDALRLAFSRQCLRTQRRSDGTVTLGGVRYDVPSRFRTLTTLTLRAPRWDPSQVRLLDPRTGHPLARLLPQDKAGHATGQRRALEPLPAAPPVPAAAADALPALLRQWLADYAATGLPPAYLPKDDLPPEDGHDHR
jgi:putative transposase